MQAREYQLRVVVVIATTPWLFIPRSILWVRGDTLAGICTAVLIPLAEHSLADGSAKTPISAPIACLKIGVFAADRTRVRGPNSTECVSEEFQTLGDSGLLTFLPLKFQ